MLIKEAIIYYFLSKVGNLKESYVLNSIIFKMVEFGGFDVYLGVVYVFYCGTTA